MKRILSAVLACVLLLGCVFALASCGATPNEDPAEAKAALEAAGYEVMLYDTPEYLQYIAAISGLKAFVSAFIEEDDEITEAVNIYYLTDDADVDKAYEAIEAMFNEAKEDVPDLKLEMGKSGNMIWFGTSAGIKAAK